MSEPWLALVIGVLYATGVYMMLRRSVVKLLVGIALLSHAANLLVFSAAGVRRGAPPIVGAGGAGASPGPTSDPLPQALVLTAIVISFGVLAFAIALLHRAHQETGSDDVERMEAPEP